MDKISNLTPHDINVVCGNGEVITYPKSGAVARCSSTTTKTGDINGIPCFSTQFGEVVGLPEQIEGTYLIVSLLVKSACNRADLLSPGELVRDSAGQPVGCKGFNR